MTSPPFSILWSIFELWRSLESWLLNWFCPNCPPIFWVIYFHKGPEAEFLLRKRDWGWWHSKKRGGRVLSLVSPPDWDRELYCGSSHTVESAFKKVDLRDSLRFPQLKFLSYWLGEGVCKGFVMTFSSVWLRLAFSVVMSHGLLLKRLTHLFPSAYSPLPRTAPKADKFLELTVPLPTGGLEGS